MKCYECGKESKLIDCRKYYDFFHNILPEIKMENLLICEECYFRIAKAIEELAKNWNIRRT